MVRQMSARLRAGHLAPPILDFLFFGQGIVNTRKKFDILAKYLGQRSGTCLALFALRFRQQIQRCFEVQRFGFALNNKCQTRHGFIKKFVPG